MTTTIKITTLALLNGKTAQPVKTGQANTFKAKLGEHYRIVKMSEGSEQLLDNVIAKRVDDDLSLNYSEGTQVTLENYYVECKASVACDVTLPNKDSVGYLLPGDDAVGVTLSDGSSLVYAHGSQDALTSMTQGNDTLHAALAGFHGSEISYVPVAPYSLGSPMLLGGLGGGALAAAGGGGSGGAASAVAAAAPNIVSGTLVGGPVISSNDLSVILYKADGVTQVGSSTHFSGTGTLSIDVGSYTGVVIAKVTNGGTGLDYIDEATGRAMDLTANLMSVGVAQAGTVHININALTTIAALKLGAVYYGSSTALITETLVTQTNTAVASAFGLSRIEGADIVTTVNLAGTANANYTPGALNAAEKYGAILAALSGVDDANSGNMQTTIDQLVHELTVTGSTGTLSQSGFAAVISGAYAAASTANGTATNSLTSVVSNLMMQTNASVSIDSVAAGDVISANGQTIIFGGTVVVGATVGLSIGGYTHSAVVSGDTWSYTLSGADISAIGRGGKAIAATATLSDGSIASVMRSFIVLADVSTTSQATADAELAAYDAANLVVTTDVSAASTDSADAATALSTATTVGTAATATAAVVAAQKWVTDAAKQSTDTALQSTAATVLMAAAVASAAIGDDAAATTAVSDSAIATTAAANNLLAANAALTAAQLAQTTLANTPAAKTAAAAADLAAYIAAAAVVVTDLTSFNADQIVSISALGQVSGTTTANAALAAAQQLLADANKAVTDAGTEKTAALALSLAAQATSEASDDAGAAVAIGQANTDTATAVCNLLVAQKAVTSAQIILDIYNGNLYPYAAPGSAIGVPVAGSTNGLPNTILLNNLNAAGAIAVADNLFSDKSNIQNLVVGNTGSGAIALALGAIYSASGISNIFLNDLSGAVAVDDSASTTNSTMTVNTLSGAVAITTGNSSDSMNINTLSGAIAVIGANGNDTINAFSQSGAVTVTLGGGNNVINAASTQAAGAVLINLTTGDNTIRASTFGGAIIIHMDSGTENIEAATLGGAVTITQVSGTGAVNIQANTGTATGAVVINVADGKNSIDATTYGGAITINTGNGNNTISASTGTGIINITTGSGNDHITVGSGTNGAVINAGGGDNSITLLAHSTLVNTIDATSANTTLVTGATIGTTLADVYKIGSTSFAALASTPETTVGGTTAVAVSATGVLSFTGVVTDTGATFANHVLDILKATPGEYAKVVSYDDGVNQWLFVATSATAGHYIELIGSHDANFAGASTTAAAHTILIG